VTREEAEELLDEVNLSELVLLAQNEDPEAHRGLGRSHLKSIILGDEEEELPLRTINKVRLRIMEFVNTHWLQVRPFVQCPAKTRDPRACFQCTDHQAVECAMSNKDDIFKEKGRNT
jgi:hypothetical protein